MILSGITSRDDKPVKKSKDHEYADVSSGLFDFLHKNKVVNGGVLVDTVGSAMAAGDSLVVTGGPMALMVNPSVMPLHGEPKITEFQKDCDLIKFPDFVEIQKGSDIEIENKNLVSNDRDQVGSNDVSMGFLYEGFIGGPSNPNGKPIDLHEKITTLNFPCKNNALLVMEQVNNKKDLESRNMDILASHILVENMCTDGTSSWPNEKDESFDGVAWASKLNGPLSSTSDNQKLDGNLLSHSKISTDGTCSKASANSCDTLLIFVNVGRSNASFDPGGTSLESGETTYEVKLLRWVVMIIMQKNRIDVPFDPGGFGTKTKLEDEFFSKRGSMMQGISHVDLNFEFPILSYS
ncbi:hypothetical protein Hanom_Chr12g01131921 [Helianthus anomalus]